MPSGATCQGGVSLKAPSDKSAGPASSSEPVSECTSLDSRRLIVGRCIRSGHAESGARGGPIRAAPCGIFSVCALPWTADNAHYVKLMGDCILDTLQSFDLGQRLNRTNRSRSTGVA